MVLNWKYAEITTDRTLAVCNIGFRFKFIWNFTEIITIRALVVYSFGFTRLGEIKLTCYLANTTRSLEVYSSKTLEIII
jgi:hypothetical protein